MTELKARILDRGRVQTPWSGAVLMADGVKYHGGVYRLDGKFYVFYQDEPVEVSWKADRYVRTATLVPCPACRQPHDPAYIPPPRVPLDIRCACCCQ